MEFGNSEFGIQIVVEGEGWCEAGLEPRIFRGYGYDRPGLSLVFGNPILTLRNNAANMEGGSVG